MYVAPVDETHNLVIPAFPFTELIHIGPDTIGVCMEYVSTVLVHQNPCLFIHVIIYVATDMIAFVDNQDFLIDPSSKLLGNCYTR